MKRVKKSYLMRYLKPDGRLDLDKYYAYSYKFDIPVCSMIGWYSESLAHEIFEAVFGKPSLRYVFFIKGSDLKAALGDIVICPTQVIIKGDIYQISPLLLWDKATINKQPEIYNTIKFLMGPYINEKDPRKIERVLLNKVKRLCYAGRVPKNFKVKRSKLSQIQKTILDRKEVLYLEEIEE